MSESEPSEEASRKQTLLSKSGHLAVLEISIAITCLLAMRQSLLRRHDFYLGLFVEHGKPHGDAKRKAKYENARLLLMYHEVTDELVVAMNVL